MWIALQFGEHFEVPTMGSQKYVTGQSMQHRKGMLEILNDAGVAYGMAGVVMKWYSDQKTVLGCIMSFQSMHSETCCNYDRNQSGDE